eukprot:TRINITY_DN1196_c0_g2_i1.p1 TRINITY_DN1196_c0_g2~~TRINITY_DN1196_c0_g2_i1.p1  ORF type:complete len:352 (+),score=54.88 TRINITY_DN1196_c0_g2_i1:61-1116(+)
MRVHRQHKSSNSYLIPAHNKVYPLFKRSGISLLGAPSDPQKTKKIMSEITEYTQHYRTSLPQREVTNNLYRWQKHWGQDHLCGYACCYASHCGSHRCESCGKSCTSTVPPLSRFICMECGDECNEEGELLAVQVCPDCFESDDFLHQHSKFMKVDGSDGQHLGVQRSVGFGDVFKFEEKDFHVNESALGECNICFMPFEKDNPAVYSIGCVKGHGFGVRDFDRGCYDTETFSCRECAQMNVLYQGGEYCARKLGDVPVLCGVCKFEKEREGWKDQFSSVRVILEGISFPFESEEDWVGFIERLNSEIEMREIDPKTIDYRDVGVGGMLLIVKDALKSLHKQKWLQDIIDDI